MKAKQFGLLLFLLLCIPIFAQEEEPEANTLETGFSIQGEIQRPQVFLPFNQDSFSEAYDLRLRESFLPKILESLEKEPL